MKKHHHKPSKSHASPKGESFENELNQVAEELVELARKRLPDKVLRGALEGLEADIRQDATLLALRWYIRGEDKSSDSSGYSWIAPRAIAETLRLKKMAYSELRRKERETTEAFTDYAEALQSGSVFHPSLQKPCDWPATVMRKVTREAIGVALKAKAISHANASIGLEVYVHQTNVSELADRLSVTRSNIYQHLSRVRRAIPNFVDGIEVSLNELMTNSF